ncbi:MAG: macro domain-containing protein [Cyanobacteria bacterium P01_H01_bin.105]
MKVYFTLFRQVGFKRLLISFASIFGLIWLLLEPASFLIPEQLSFGAYGYLALVLVSLTGAIFRNSPKRSVSNFLSSPDTEVEVKVGDLFQEKSHLVIGLNDVFDTEPGEIIKASAVQGQFLEKIYRNNLSQLDIDIETALQTLNVTGQLDPAKTHGKAYRYPIGTTITLGSYERRYFLTAYGYMNNDLTIASNSDYSVS